MFKRFLCLSVSMFLLLSGMTYAKDKNNSRNETNKYLKTQKKIKKLNKRKSKETRKINYLKHRFEVQEQKLEVLTSSDNDKKGEKE